MKEHAGNRFEMDIINENLVKIQAKCLPKQTEERNYDSKESLFQISNNSLALSNTLSSLNTIRVSKSSLAGSIWIGGAETQNRETPKKSSPGEEKSNGNFIFYDVKKSDSTEIKKQTKFQNLKLEISKINNFFEKTIKTEEEEEETEEKNNENICSQSIIHIPKGDEQNKLEISNKSIFFTPSTICNYYQPSYLENSPNQENSKLRIKNLDDLNEDHIPKAINLDLALSKLTPPQIKYTKGQLQSQERSEKQNANQVFVPPCKNKINFENETNNFTLHNINFDEKKENVEKSKEGKKEFHNFHDLVNEIKKELVLNISAIEEDVSISNNNIMINVEEEEKSKGGFQNAFVKNLGLNFCEMKIGKEPAHTPLQSVHFSEKIQISKPTEAEQKKIEYLRQRKNLSCISEISLNIKPTNSKEETAEKLRDKNLSSNNLIIQRPDNISISLDEKKIPISNKINTTNKKSIVSSLSKNKAGQKSNSKVENNYNILSSYSKQNNTGSAKVSSAKRDSSSKNSCGNKSPDAYTRRVDSKGKNLSYVVSNSKNKSLKSIILNLVGNLIETNVPSSTNSNGKASKKNEGSVGKSVISPSNVQTTVGSHSTYQKTNTNSSNVDTERATSRPNSNNAGVINNKKKEYLELIKLLASGSEHSNNRNKLGQEQRNNSKGKTFEVTINLDQSDKRTNSAKKSVHNTSLNNSKCNSTSKKDATITSSVKKSNKGKINLPTELSKIQSMKMDNRNLKKNVPFNCPQTSKNPKNNLVYDLMNNQKKAIMTKKVPEKMFINIHTGTPSNAESGSKKNVSDHNFDGSGLKKEMVSSTKSNSSVSGLVMDRKCESYKNQAEAHSLFKNEGNVVNLHKHKSEFVKIINNFSNYTKIKKECGKGKENVNFTNDSSYENKKQVTALQIRNSGGDEDSVFVDE